MNHKDKKVYIAPICITHDIEMEQCVLVEMSKEIDNNEHDGIVGDAKDREYATWNEDYGTLW